MPVTLRIAFRNLFEHRSKSLIIGILLALGSLVLVVGNSFIDASRQGIRSSFTDNYTGDVFISGISQDGDVSLFGVTSVGGMAPTPIIPEFDKVIADIRARPEVDKATGMATGFAIVTRGDDLVAEMEEMDAEEERDPSARFLFMFGIDATDYWTVFDSLEISSGKAFAPGQAGLIVNEAQLAKISKWMKKDIAIGDSLVVQAFSSGGMKLRELPVVATYRQKSDGSTPEQMAFVDIDSLRVMAGMTVGTNENIDLGEAQTALLAADDTDALFGDDLFEDGTASAGFDEAAIQSQLADTTARQAANTADTGAWQFIVLKAKPGTSVKALIADLNGSFASQGIAVTAGDWQRAAGPYGQSVDVIRIVFTVAIAILSIVAIIIIMNTLSMAALERVSEIGMMRAVGAHKSFIAKMFFTETAIISFVFGGAGILFGIVVVFMLGLFRITTENQVLVLLFGGNVFRPFLDHIDILICIVMLSAVTVIATLYPLRVARGITPLDAIMRD